MNKKSRKPNIVEALKFQCLLFCSDDKCESVANHQLVMKRHLLDLINLDALGFSASAICAVHCLAMPFVITLLPVIGLSFLAHPAFEVSLIASGLIIGAFSLSHGYLKHHHNLLPILILSTGFGLIAVGHVEPFEPYEFLIVSFGASLVATAHILNYRLLKHEKNCVH